MHNISKLGHGIIKCAHFIPGRWYTVCIIYCIWINLNTTGLYTLYGIQVCPIIERYSAMQSLPSEVHYIRNISVMNLPLIYFYKSDCMRQNANIHLGGQMNLYPVQDRIQERPLIKMR